VQLYVNAETESVVVHALLYGDTLRWQLERILATYLVVTNRNGGMLRLNASRRDDDDDW